MADDPSKEEFLTWDPEVQLKYLTDKGIAAERAEEYLTAQTAAAVDEPEPEPFHMEMAALLDDALAAQEEELAASDPSHADYGEKPSAEEHETDLRLEAWGLDLETPSLSEGIGYDPQANTLTNSYTFEDPIAEEEAQMEPEEEAAQAEAEELYYPMIDPSLLAGATTTDTITGDMLDDTRTSTEIAYEESVELATDAASEYLSAREDREALEAELASGILVSANYSKDRQYEEIEKIRAEIEVAKFVEETALDTAAATEALKVTASEDLMLAEEQAAIAAEWDAEVALLKEQIAIREEVKIQLAIADAVVSDTDIMKGEGISGAEDIEALEAAAAHAAEVWTGTVVAESSEATQKEAEELYLQATEVIDTAKETVSIVKEELATEAEEVLDSGGFLLSALAGEEGISVDAAGNLTTGENLDTREEREDALAYVADQLAEIEDLLDPDKAMEFHNDANDDGQVDPGEMVVGLQKDFLDPETVERLETQQADLEKLTQQITDAEKLIGFKGDLLKAKGGHGDPNAKSIQAFWTNAPKYDPKLKFRFRVRIDGMAIQDALGKTADDNPGDDHYNDTKPIVGDDEVWYAKSVDKPKITFATIGADFIPLGRQVASLRPRPEMPSFGAVSMVLVDPGYPNATRKLIRWLRRTGYNDTRAKAAMKLTYNEDPATAFLKTIGNVQIEQLDANGFPLEKWTLVDAFPQEIDFGQLDYSSNDLVEIKITWAYRTIKVKFAAHGAEEEFDYFSQDGYINMTDDQQAEAMKKQAQADNPAPSAYKTPPKTK